MGISEACAALRGELVHSPPDPRERPDAQARVVDSALHRMLFLQI